ncbi:amidohydrolase family protein [Simkania negevensis]|uniref:Amidohydrolase 2 n=1 Tax=Simkania negevensis (strain ATCC VR-1471 / DSM 27360 / Z) TaxID=331113 RepID=F8L846_SIMNZ|nr:amidohydrolase family protein [Simkania negevensis]CCB88955.1 amidohydrolase 2 [Simkania negevensis Z]
MKIFDSHFHLIDPQFPLFENQGFLPKPFLLSDYQKWMEKLEIQGGALVSGSFQQFDTSYLSHFLPKLGPQFYGVAQLPASISDEEIMRLNQAGVRAVRFNVKRGGSESLEELEKMAHRVYDLARWHVELYIDAKDLPSLNLPKVSIDHLGLSAEGLPSLLKWVERGARVKATGFGRLNCNPLPLLQQIHQVNPEALMFGTDLPSTRAKRPFELKDVELILQNFLQEDYERLLWENGISFYST